MMTVEAGGAKDFRGLRTGVGFGVATGAGAGDTIGAGETGGVFAGAGKPLLLTPL